VNQGEIVIYKSIDDSAFQLEVRVDAETVWLNRHQIALLFDRDVKTIGKHIANALNEELHGISVVANYATTAADGKTYKVDHYNLEMIISIGYRVKSQRGTQFRIWANRVLKEYLIKGYAANRRFERIEDDLFSIKKRVDEIDFQVKTHLPPNEGIFYDGQIFDAYKFVAEIVKSATKSIVLIDNYIDETVLVLFAKRSEDVNVQIYTSELTEQLKLDLKRYNAQYPKVEVRMFKKSHDRFLIIDGKTVYHIGASLKDLGKKWFAFSKIEINATELIDKLK